MELGFVVPTLLLFATFTALPFWRHSRKWGYVPAAIMFTALIVLGGLIWFERFA